MVGWSSGDALATRPLSGWVLGHPADGAPASGPRLPSRSAAHCPAMAPSQSTRPTTPADWCSRGGRGGTVSFLAESSRITGGGRPPPGAPAQVVRSSGHRLAPGSGAGLCGGGAPRAEPAGTPPTATGSLSLGWSRCGGDGPPRSCIPGTIPLATTLGGDGPWILGGHGHASSYSAPGAPSPPSPSSLPFAVAPSSQPFSSCTAGAPAPLSHPFPCCPPKPTPVRDIFAMQCPLGSEMKGLQRGGYGALPPQPRCPIAVIEKCWPRPQPDQRLVWRAGCACHWA